MKIHLLFAACLILVGCGRREQSNAEILGKLEIIQSELTKHGGAVRWAFANKSEIDSAIFKWSRDKMEEVKKSEALPPEMEQKIQQYEVLQSQLMRKEMEARGFKLPVRAVREGTPEVSVPDESYEVLSNRVAAAKAPLADILEQRKRQASQYRGQFSAEKLIAEYVKDRFDLVVDSSDERMSWSAVLYRTTGERMDITQAVIGLFKEKAKP